MQRQIITISLFAPSSLAIIYKLQQLIHQTYPQLGKLKIYVCLSAAFANPYFFGLFSIDLIDSLQQICITLFIFSQVTANYSNSLSFLLIAVASAINPINLVLALQGFILSKSKSILKQIVLFTVSLALTTFAFIYLQEKSALTLYKPLFFPQTFNPQSNMLWLLYSHMFERYLSLYQLSFVFIAFSSLYLVNHITIPAEMKLLILAYIKLFCQYRCSQICLFLAMLIQISLLSKFLPKLLKAYKNLNNNFQKCKINVLTTVVAGFQLNFHIVNKLFINKYLNDFTMNSGYLLVYQGVFWVVRSIYLSEIISTSVACETQLSLHQEGKTQIRTKNDKQ